MQTFLPYPDFAASAACLDRQRLGKQRVECLQIMRALYDPAYGWQNHPAVKMWRGFDCTLYEYAVTICREWVKRGYKDTCHGKLKDLHYSFRGQSHIVCAVQQGTDECSAPFIGNDAFHASHHSNLIRKLPSHYRPLWPDVPDNLPYMWPTT